MIKLFSALLIAGLITSCASSGHTYRYGKGKKQKCKVTMRVLPKKAQCKH